ncbi:MAG: hypothetical protein AAF548_18305 [Actinomycetota bacterium]
MRHRVITPLVILFALIAASCGDDPAPAAADRSVDESGPEWERDQTILRTVLIEEGLDAGLSRGQAACMIDTITGAEESAWTMEDLEGIDMSAQTSSNASGSLAEALGDALVDCGPALSPSLDEDIPGATTIPGTHTTEYDCVVNAYVDAWREAYIDRFDGGSIDEPTPIDVSDHTVAIVNGCEAAGAVILGASNAGNLDTFSLTTLAWECMVERLDADQFLPAFPFPDDAGDALDRLGNGVLGDAAYCEEYAAPGSANS